MTNDLDSNPPDSLTSTPRSDHHHQPDDSSQRIRFMCSFGGKILPRPHDNQLRYVGGDTRIVSLHRHSATYSSLLSKLSKLTTTSSIAIKYQLPNEDLDALITVTSDEDLDNMIEEFDRLSNPTNSKSSRLRLFLFPTQITPDSRTSSINSLLDGSAKRESWFVDALNGPALDRARSEVSSIVSEVPDYLFGLENSDDHNKIARTTKNHLLNDNVSNSDPGSPAPVVSISASSPFCSTSSSLAPSNIIPDLPPVRTKPENDKTGYSGTGSPMWHYPNPAMQQPTVYYVPNSHVQAGNVPMRAQYVQPYQVAQGQVPVGFPGMGQVYGGQPARIYMENGGHPMYYGARNMAVVPGNYPGMVVSGGEDVQGHGTDRVLQGS